MNPTDYLSAPEFARKAKVNRITVYKWIERGHLMHYRFGSGPRATIVIPKSELPMARRRMRAHAKRV